MCARGDCVFEFERERERDDVLFVFLFSTSCVKQKDVFVPFFFLSFTLEPCEKNGNLHTVGEFYSALLDAGNAARSC